MLAYSAAPPFPSRPTLLGPAGVPQMFVLFLHLLVAASCVSFALAPARGLTRSAAAPLPTQPADAGPVRGTPPKRRREKGDTRRGHALRSMCRLRLRAAPSGQNGGPGGPLARWGKDEQGSGRSFRNTWRKRSSAYFARTPSPRMPPPLSEGVLFRSLAGCLFLRGTFRR